MSDANGTRKRFGWFIAKPDGKTDIARSTKEFTAENWAEFKSIIAVTSELRQQGLLIRDCSSLEGCTLRMIRIALRAKPDNNRLLAALGAILRQ